MAEPVNLGCFGKAELHQFIDSFDTVITDCDGVLYILFNPIPGTPEVIKMLREMKKDVRFVSNNSTMSFDMFQKTLNRIGFPANSDEILFPTVSIIHYLKSVHFNKKAYVLGFENMKKDLRDAGIEIVDNTPKLNTPIEEQIPEVMKLLIDDEQIGAVILDMDVNMNYEKLMKSATYLQRSDVLFLVGATDYRLPVGKSHLMGPAYYYKMLEDFTGRKATILGKPGVALSKLVIEKFQIKDPKRTLFIGDSLHQDMSFATLCGFQKLFVLTGTNTLEQALHSEKENIPDYYINSLGDLGTMLNKCCL